MNSLPLSIEVARESDDAAIEKLHQRAFGPGRFARTAYRVREQAGPTAGFGFVARVGSLLVGSVQLTPVEIGGARVLILGPLTVEPAFEGRGIGGALLVRSAEAAQTRGYSAILLVGDEAYYSRHGYRRVPPGRILMPGPVDPSRLLILLLPAEAAIPKGAVRAQIQ
jgi:predicted N-acetyltransferase YhbS